MHCQLSAKHYSSRKWIIDGGVAMGHTVDVILGLLNQTFPTDSQGRLHCEAFGDACPFHFEQTVLGRDYETL